MFFSRPKRSNKFNDDVVGTTAEAAWELRPGGMLVQKRNSDANRNNSVSLHTSTVKIKVKYGSTNHEIRISSHASFGELKKMLSERTGLHPEDQKLIFRNKERDSKSYLDEAKVKDGSKMVMEEDIQSRQRRALEMLKIANKDKISKCLTQINSEVDKFAKQVGALEESGRKGGIIAEMEVDELTENLMGILIKLDGIVAEGDLKLQRREQVKRVQKHIETLDKLKLPQETKVHTNEAEQKQPPMKHYESFVVTTKWETFD
ncbi:BAG family molecular chaperone regulator 1-like isoform X1 [Senna tora]|uniref:BAG family molecular chaperone regulator 1-like isoform X1 n=1 Tax=Senna tora TaxID=362788 RepID=A0A834TX13_9FABA|nr:BAG family molecular chaperone regulator 1-like isoform X1 [Senna tora]